VAASRGFSTTSTASVAITCLSVSASWAAWGGGAARVPLPLSPSCVHGKMLVLLCPRFPNDTTCLCIPLLQLPAQQTTATWLTIFFPPHYVFWCTHRLNKVDNLSNDTDFPCLPRALALAPTLPLTSHSSRRPWSAHRDTKSEMIRVFIHSKVVREGPKYLQLSDVEWLRQTEQLYQCRALHRLINVEYSDKKENTRL